MDSSFSRERRNLVSAHVPSYFKRSLRRWYFSICTANLTLVHPVGRKTLPCTSYAGLIQDLKGQVDIKVKWSRYRPGVAQRVGSAIALLFHDRGTRRGWVVSSTPRPHFTPGKDPVPILEENGRAPGPVWMGGKSRPYRVSVPDRPARSPDAIPTELPGPQRGKYLCENNGYSQQ